MEQYFITLHSFSIEEYEVWRQLNKHCDYNTNIAGYTVNQLVVNSDKRLDLTTQKVRTILKGFEKKGYIKFISRGGKGKESTLKITIKKQLFNKEVKTKNSNLANYNRGSNGNRYTRKVQML
jgi:MarR-like DNA-binding transcriptional regulator SgrR of sgrS sRNA